MDNDPWGVPYRIVTKRFSRQRPGVAARGRESEIADALFPERPLVDWSNVPLEDPGGAVEESTEEEGPELTAEELSLAALRLPRGKAPGPDGVPNELLTAVAAKSPGTLLGVYRQCLATAVFPSPWKRARLVLLQKGPDRPIEDPSSFRPLCMLDSAGKLLERILLRRLSDHLDNTGGLNDNQFGYRRGKSTEDAITKILDAATWAGQGDSQYQDLCVVVALDVRNAFNSAPWDHIDAALRAKSVPRYLVRILRSYMTDRLLYDRGCGRGAGGARRVTCGVPQGSVLGPTLWNVYYDDLLRTEVPPGVQLVAFADDLAIVAVARTSRMLEAVVNPTLAAVDEWIRRHGLRLAEQKTEAILLTKKRNHGIPALTVGGHPVTMRKTMRYLGVTLDTRLSFRSHTENVGKKAAAAAGALGRLMPNVGGPSQKKRALLMSVVNSRLFYAAPTWASRATKFDVCNRAITRAQRLAALRVTRAYRTVSAEAAMFLANSPPGDLVAQERENIRRRKDEDDDEPVGQIAKTERRKTNDRWQVRWSRGEKGAWTRSLLPSVQRWQERPKMDLTYHLTQALTGHGCFQEYLFRMRRATDPSCVYCRFPEDTAEHTLFNCGRWSSERRQVNALLGGRDVRPSDVEDMLCGPRDLPSSELDPSLHTRLVDAAKRCAHTFHQMCKEILSRKEQDERERQAEGRVARRRAILG